jgi:hypothetical protein
VTQRLIYVAGPFRAATPEAITINVSSVSRVALALWRMGASVICPHLNSGWFYGKLTEEAALAGCLTMLRRCDALVLAPGWEESRGARDERAEAYEARMPVFCWPEQREQIAAYLSNGGLT